MRTSLMRLRRIRYSSNRGNYLGPDVLQRKVAEDLLERADQVPALVSVDAELDGDAIDDQTDPNQQCSNDPEFSDWVEIDAEYRDFSDEWIFNIEDFVNVLFEAANNGSYTVQIRFYPLPLN